MTKAELSQLYFLNREIEEQQRRVEELECVLTSCTGRITGMPRASGVSQKILQYTAELVDLKAELEINIKKCFLELNRLNRYIESIEDSATRMIFALRYVNGLSWKQVAASIGGGNTEDSVRMLHNRHIKKT